MFPAEVVNIFYAKFKKLLIKMQSFELNFFNAQVFTLSLF
jgi:hypothetical protein